MVPRNMKIVVLGGRGPAASALEAQLASQNVSPPHGALASEVNPDLHDCAFVDETGGGEDAAELCRSLARRAPQLPVLVATLRRDPHALQELLDAGATDYLRWPEDAPLLPLRLRALQHQRSEDAEKFHLLFHNELDAISLTDLATGRFVDVNEAWSQLYGFSREEAVGRMGPKDVSAEENATHAAILRVQQGGPPCRHVRWHRARNGTVFPVEIYAGSYEFRGRRVLVAMIRDITDRVRLEAQLRQSDRLASVGTLAAAVAHDINNPLAFVVTNLDYLQTALSRHERGGVLDTRVVLDAIDEARDGARRVREIVRDLKTFSRAEDVSDAAVDVATVMDVALRLVSNEVRHRAEFTRDYQRVPKARASEARLGQVFVNLLSNAVQALPDRPKEKNRLHVAVHLSAAGEVVAEVTDNGAGISPDLRARIFDPFFTTKPVGEGTGLGLAICQTLVTGLGGRIEVDSQRGEGSTFRVILQAARAEEAKVSLGSLSVEPAPGTSQRLKLLLIDDERNLGLVLGRALEEDVDLEFVTSGRDGLQKIAGGQRFDAVVCDLMMPTMTGMEFYEELRRVDEKLAARTGFITGGTFTPPARDFASRMSGRIIEKPFMAEDLQRFVRTLVSAR